MNKIFSLCTVSDQVVTDSTFDLSLYNCIGEGTVEQHEEKCDLCEFGCGGSLSTVEGCLHGGGEYAEGEEQATWTEPVGRTRTHSVPKVTTKALIKNLPTASIIKIMVFLLFLLLKKVLECFRQIFCTMYEKTFSVQIIYGWVWLRIIFYGRKPGLALIIIVNHLENRSQNSIRHYQMKFKMTFRRKALI